MKFNDLVDDLERAKAKDRAELEWWRNFATKFFPDELPKVGEPLLGYRLKVQFHANKWPGEWVDWKKRYDH